MKYPLGIQTFSKVINDNLLYIDKTATIHQLIQQGSVYFLSRPRRFGKSLLISTLAALFSGHKSLFANLAISKSHYDFAAYPIVKMEFSSDEFTNAQSLREYIDDAVNDIALLNNIVLNKKTYNKRFAELIVKLHSQTQQKVVLLIDEYDKPILDNLYTPELAEIKTVYSAFYSAIKSLDEHLRFVFITGVTKFAKVSVFSGMNSLTDISMDSRYATLCGVTQQELIDHFSQALEQLCRKEQLDNPQLLAKIKNWYNGYCFEENSVTVYNPYSLLSLFDKLKFDHYWFATGTPTFLIELIKNKQFDLAQIAQFEVDSSAFMAIEPEQISPLIALLQTGYLTISHFKDGWYKLDYPNDEVKYAFNQAVVTQFANTEPGSNTGYLRQLA